jgi:hypothetical protein
MSRAAAAIAGLALLVPVLAGLYLVLTAITWIEAPNPSGFFPGWADVGWWIGLIAVAALVIAGLAAAASAALRWSATGRRPGRRWVTVPPIAVLAATTAGTAVAFLSVLDDGPDCSTFAFDRHRWNRATETVALGVYRCHTLDGMTRSQVDARLGPPQSGHRFDGHRMRWTYELLDVTFDDDVVVRVSPSIQWRRWD